MKRWLLALAAVTAGCTIEQKVSVHPMRTVTIKTTASRDDAFTAVVKGTMASGLGLAGSDRVVGVASTNWKSTVQDDGILPVVSGAAIDGTRSRRVMFTMAVDDGRVVITPKPELCKRNVCGPAKDLTTDDIALLQILEGNIASELGPASPVQVQPGMTVVVENTRGNFYRGVVVQALPSTLTIASDGAQYEIPTGEIKSLHVEMPK